MNFTTFNKHQIDLWDLDIYSELAKELKVARDTAKTAFWKFVMGGGDARLGAALNNMELDDMSREELDSYFYLGASVRPILNHYALQWFRILAHQDKISFNLSLDIHKSV